MALRPRFLLLLGLIAVLLPGIRLEAQLRPLDPINWAVLQPDRTLSAEAGIGVYQDQRASLAGTEGQLLELGTFRLVWNTGRVGLEAAGTVRRVFEDETVFAAPVEGTRAPDGSRRTDSGDYRLATTVRLTPKRPDLIALLRFGTRLPTTDNVVGLERDQTDFFATVAGRIKRGGASISAETGVGIFGSSVVENFEQSDVWLYAISTAYQTRWITPSLELVGQADGLQGWTIRGTENLQELRMGVRVGDEFWVRLNGVKGLTPFSPQAGLVISAGMLR